MVYGRTVGWLSKYQPFIILLSTEAEYIAAVETGKEIKCMRNILTQFGYPLSYTLTLFIGNKSEIKVIRNLEYHECMKYLNLQHY